MLLILRVFPLPVDVLHPRNTPHLRWYSAPSASTQWLSIRRRLEEIWWSRPPPRPPCLTVTTFSWLGIHQLFPSSRQVPGRCRFFLPGIMKTSPNSVVVDQDDRCTVYSSRNLLHCRPTVFHPSFSQVNGRGNTESEICSPRVFTYKPHCLYFRCRLTQH